MINCADYNSKEMNPGGMWKDRIVTRNLDGTRDVQRDIAVARKCPLRECKTNADCSARSCEDLDDCPGAEYDKLMNDLESTNSKRGQSLSNTAVCAWWKGAGSERSSACVLD